jgi:hypothetical protein
MKKMGTGISTFTVKKLRPENCIKASLFRGPLPSNDTFRKYFFVDPVARVARWQPKIPIWVNFGGSCNM